MKYIYVYFLYYRKEFITPSELLVGKDCKQFLKHNKKDKAFRLMDYSYYPFDRRKHGRYFTHTYPLGYCKDRKQVQQMIEIYRKAPGFKDWPVENFFVHPWRIEVDKDVKKEDFTFYDLTHEYEESWRDEKGRYYFDYITFFPPMATEEEVIELKEKIFKEYPYNQHLKEDDNWYIGKYNFDPQKFAFLEGFD